MNSRGLILAILVTYNSEIYIEKCIQSLKNQTYTSIDILVVDNASTDNTVKIIRDKYKEIKIIECEYNTGFAKGNNLGLEYAIKKKYDYTLIINEDVVVDKNLVQNLLKYANETTVVAPDIYSDLVLENLWYSNGYMDFEKGIAANVTYRNDTTLVNDVSFISGCCELVHTDIWKKIGGFSEEYFLYYEDVDLSMKMILNHISMRCTHETWVWHRIKSSGRKPYYYYYMARNRFLFLKKYQRQFKHSIEYYLNEYYRRWEENSVPESVIQAERLGIADYKDDISGYNSQINMISDKDMKLKIQYGLINLLCRYSFLSIKPNKFLEIYNYTNVAIYGKHFLGQRLCDWLICNNVKVNFFIDQKNSLKYKNIEVYN